MAGNRERELADGRDRRLLGDSTPTEGDAPLAIIPGRSCQDLTRDRSDYPWIRAKPARSTSRAPRLALGRMVLELHGRDEEEAPDRHLQDPANTQIFELVAAFHRAPPGA